MKKILVIASVCLLTLSIGYSQSTYDNSYASNGPSSNNDDVYSANSDNNSDYTDNNNSYDNNPDNYAAPDYQTFHEQLNAYGNWVNYPGYGNVWVPQVSADFSPYVTNGHWAYTDYGWSWASDYDWGWATFHYGRWFRDVAYGWMWVPGYDWAPAWVMWGDYNNYYCWAPIGPDYDVNSYGYYRPASYSWNFIPYGEISCGHPSEYIVHNNYFFQNRHDHEGVHIHVINSSGISHEKRFFAGPNAQDVERNTGQHITHVNVSAANRVPVNAMHRLEQPNHQQTLNQISRADNGNMYNNNRNESPSTNMNSVHENRMEPLNQNSFRNQVVQQNNSHQSYAQQQINRPERQVAANNNRSSTPVNNAGHMQEQRNIQQNGFSEQHHAQQVFSQPQQRQSFSTGNAVQRPTPQPAQRAAERNFASAQRPVERISQGNSFQNSARPLSATSGRGGRR